MRQLEVGATCRLGRKLEMIVFRPRPLSLGHGILVERLLFRLNAQATQTIPKAVAVTHIHGLHNDVATPP